MTSLCSCCTAWKLARPAWVLVHPLLLLMLKPACKWRCVIWLLTSFTGATQLQGSQIAVQRLVPPVQMSVNPVAAAQAKCTDAGCAAACCACAFQHVPDN